MIKQLHKRERKEKKEEPKKSSEKRRRKKMGLVIKNHILQLQDLLEFFLQVVDQFIPYDCINAELEKYLTQSLVM